MRFKAVVGKVLGDQFIQRSEVLEVQVLQDLVEEGSSLCTPWERTQSDGERWLKLSARKFCAVVVVHPQLGLR